MNEFSFLSCSPKETISLAGRLARLLRGGEVIYLLGEMGTGKTLFARGFISSLGFDGYVTSSTFVLQQVYNCDPPVVHLDLYRIEKEEELLDLGWEDFVGEYTMLVEWADRFSHQIPAAHITVSFKAVEEEKRKITIKAIPEYGDIIRRLADDTGN